MSLPLNAAPATDEAVDLLLVLAIDVSESINRAEADLQRQGYTRAIVDPDVIDAIRRGRRGRIAVTYVEWSGPEHQRQIVGWTRITDAETARRFGAELARAPVGRGRWTSISGVIDFAATLFARAPYSAQRHVIDISSDGRNNAGPPLEVSRKRGVNRGITINALVVLAKKINFSWPPMPYLDLYFQRCVIGGPGAFVEVAEIAHDFSRAVRRKLIREIAGKGDEDGGIKPAAGLLEKQFTDCRESPKRAEAGTTVR